MSGNGQCRSCGAPILWVKLTTGKNNPLDVRTESEPRRGRVVVNPRTGKGKVLADADIPAAARWLEAGATLHRSHFATCPDRQKHRKKPEPEIDADAELERVTQKFPELDH